MTVPHWLVGIAWGVSLVCVGVAVWIVAQHRKCSECLKPFAVFAAGRLHLCVGCWRKRRRERVRP